MFNNKLTKKVLSITSAIAIMGAMAIPSLAAQPQTQPRNITVFYTSENIIPGPGDAKWGVKIPTGVSFTNDDKGVAKTGPQYDIELVTLDANQKPLDQIYSTLKVSGTVKSENGYKFVKQGDPSKTAVGSYSYKAGNNKMNINDKADQALPELNIDTKDHSKIVGEFTLLETLTEKGSFTDTLTFTFTQQEATPKK